MTPSKRSFTTRGSSTTEAALLTRGVSQLYISLGDTDCRWRHCGPHLSQAAGALIWFGSVLMAFGGVLSLSDRRCASARRSRRSAARPAGGGVG